MLRKTAAVFGCAVVIHALILWTAAAAAQKDIALPRPAASLNADVMKTFRERRSVRDFTTQGVSLNDMAALLWAGCGINRPDGKRTVPSAGGQDFIDLYAILDRGVYYYDPRGHTLKFVSGANIKGKIAQQGFAADAPLIVVLVGKAGVSSSPEKAREQMHLINFTAGCACQDIYLAANALGLGTVVMGSIDRDVLTKSMNLNRGQFPLYIMPVGHPRNSKG